MEVDLTTAAGVGPFLYGWAAWEETRVTGARRARRWRTWCRKVSMRTRARLRSVRGSVGGAVGVIVVVAGGVAAGDHPTGEGRVEQLTRHGQIELTLTKFTFILDPIATVGAHIIVDAVAVLVSMPFARVIVNAELPMGDDVFTTINNCAKEFSKDWGFMSFNTI